MQTDGAARRWLGSRARADVACGYGAANAAGGRARPAFRCCVIGLAPGSTRRIALGRAWQHLPGLRRSQAWR